MNDKKNIPRWMQPLVAIGVFEILSQMQIWSLIQL